MPGVILVALLMVVSAGAVVASLSGGESTSATPSLPGPTSSLSPSASPRTPNLPNFPSAFPSVGSALPSSAYSPSSLAPVGGAPLGKPASTLPFSVSNPQTAAFVQQVNHAIAAGTVPRYAAYLPNYNLYAHPISDPSQIVSPRYTTFPAPMGLGDFGLNGGGSYVNYTPSFDGQFTLSAYNATAGGLYEDTGAYYWDGLSPNQGVSPYQSGVQLNTVMTNVSIPGSTTAAFWTQNVIDFQQGQLTFVDNVWNFSALALNLGTIYSGNGSVVPGNFYYDLGPKIPLTFPIAVNLYNNASVVNGRTQVTFGYAIGESGHVYHGVYDTVVFNSISAPLPADFMVNGNTATPIGTLYDAELVFTGPGGGSNAVINAINGTLNLWEKKGGSYMGTPAAFDYGADTGETAVGVATTWRGTTASVDTGPSLLYGLWGVTGGVGSGSIHLSVALHPNYTWIFFGFSGTQTYNMSWAPTNAAGTMDTYLPPHAPGYASTLFADGYLQTNTSFSGTSGFSGSISLLSPDPTFLDAPLYMQSAAQATALSAATGGSGSAPFTFKNLNVAVNLTFNRLNDWGFPTFNLFQAGGFAAAVDVDHIAQGPNWHGITQWFQSPFGYTGNLPALGGQIVVYDGSNDVFANLSLVGLSIPAGVNQGGALSLWNDTGASVDNTIATRATFGVWAASSPHTTVKNSAALDGAAVFSLMASDHGIGQSLFSALGSAAIYDVGGTAGTFSWVNTTLGADGFYGVWVNGTTANWFNASASSNGIYLTGGVGTTVTNLWSNDSHGLVGMGLVDTSVTDLTALNNTSPGVGLTGATGVTVTNAYVNNSLGIGVVGSDPITIRGVTANGNSEGVVLQADTGASVTTVSSNASVGVVVVGSVGPVAVSGVTVTGDGVGVDLDASSNDTVSNVTTTGSLGVEIEISVGPNSISGVTVDGLLGVNIVSCSEVTVSTVSVTGGGLGMIISASHDITVSGVTVTDASLGVEVDPSPSVAITGVTVTDRSLGVELLSTWSDTVTGTSASGISLGVWISNSNTITVSDTTVSNASIGVYSYHSGEITISGVTASNATLSNPWGLQTYWQSTAPYAPIAAVDTIVNYQTSITNVVATNYPAALFDYESGYNTYGPGSLYVQNLNASGGEYAVVLNYTEYGYFGDIGAYRDSVGIWQNYGEYDQITNSNFVGDAGYGVSLWFSYEDWVWNNNFIGDNGATTTYNAAHLQAYSGVGSGYNFFNGPNNLYYVGNYWSDWHTYTSNGRLAPYYVGDNSWDYYPLGIGAGTYAVTFYESGLAPGTMWSVTFNGASQSTQGTSVQFGATAGTATFTVGAVTGYMMTPSSGSVTTSAGPQSVDLSFHALYNVTVTESGLASGMSWTAILGGTVGTSSTATITFSLPSGTYAYQVTPIAGFTTSPSAGSLTVGTGGYALAVTFTQVSYAVTVSENGLSAGTTWTATVNGVTQSTAGTAITFYLPNGTYTFSVPRVNGYSVSGGTGTITVSGSPGGAEAGFTPNNSPSVVSSSTYNTGFALAIVVAVIALLIGLLALFWRRKKEPPAAPPATWSPPAETTTTSAEAPTGDGSSSWSEGPASPP